MILEIIDADLSVPAHCNGIINLLNHYAEDPMGGGNSISDFVKENLIKELVKRPASVILMALLNREAVGLTIAFEGFSTFYCKPLINIHDFVVHSSCRRKGIGYLMLEKLERKAKERGCCKITLEVLEGNTNAQSLYKRFGFEGYELDQEFGKALFWEKKIKD